jgi:hypothetical protein
MRKIAYIAGAAALAATVAVMWPRIAPIASQARTAAVTGTVGQSVRPTAPSQISPSELTKALKDLPVENWPAI